MTKQEIQDEIINSIAQLFELEVSDIHPESKLYEDLDLDSIDSIDLVVHLQKIAGVKIDPESFKSVRTVADVDDAVDQIINQ